MQVAALKSLLITFSTPSSYGILYKVQSVLFPDPFQNGLYSNQFGWPILKRVNSWILSCNT